MDNRAFERVCCYLASAKCTFANLFKERDKHDYEEVGDWRGLIESIREGVEMRYPEFVLKGTKCISDEIDATLARLRSAGLGPDS